MSYRFSNALIVFSLALGFATPAFTQTATKKSPASSATSSAKKTAAPAPAVLTERQRAIHALNRLTFGPRPGDVEAVMAKGLDGWIEDQLHPESINDAALNARLGPYATTRMDAKQLVQSFPPDGLLRQAAAGKLPMTTDPELKLVYTVNIARLQQQDANKNAGTNPGASPAAGEANGSAAAAPSPQDQARAIAEHLLALPKEQRLAALENAPPEQLANFPNLLRPDQRDRLNADATPHEREIIRALANPAAVIAFELQQAKVLREIYSERQLQEVMTDFWFNHFNVFQNKDQGVYYTAAYERDVIRPRVFGKFYDLLVATAQSPAMLIYLDNWVSAGPQSEAARKESQPGPE